MYVGAFEGQAAVNPVQSVSFVNPETQSVDESFDSGKS